MQSKQIRQSGETEYSAERDYRCGVRAGRGGARGRGGGNGVAKADGRYRFIHRFNSGPRSSGSVCRATSARNPLFGLSCVAITVSARVVVTPWQVVSISVKTCARKRVNVRNSISDDITAIALRHAWRAAKCTSAPTFVLLPFSPPTRRELGAY